MLLLNRKKKIALNENGKKKCTNNKNIYFFFDFIENYYVPKNISKNNLNMVKKIKFC